MPRPARSPAAVEVTTFKERPGAKVLVEAEIVLGEAALLRWGCAHACAPRSWCVRVVACLRASRRGTLPPDHPHAVPLPLVLPLLAAEKDRQKGIIIGKGGSALKQLGTAARAGAAGGPVREPRQVPGFPAAARVRCVEGSTTVLTGATAPPRLVATQRWKSSLGGPSTFLCRSRSARAGAQMQRSSTGWATESA